MSLAQNSGAKSLLVLTGNKNNYAEETLNLLLRDCPLTLFGVIYPILTLQDSLIKQGALIIGFKENIDVTVFSQLHLLTNLLKKLTSYLRLPLLSILIPTSYLTVLVMHFFHCKAVRLIIRLNFQILPCTKPNELNVNDVENTKCH